MSKTEQERCDKEQVILKQMEAEMENLDSIMNIVIDLYIQHSKLSKDELLEILKKDLWLDSKKCFLYGLVDVIY